MTHPKGKKNRPDPIVWSIFSVFFGVVLVTLDISLTSTSLPAISKGLAIEAAQTIWIVKVYYVAVVAALLPLAAMGEIIGYRRVFLTGLFVFSIGSLVCGLAPNIEWLIAGRAFLGLGSAAVSATTPALIKSLYAPEKLGRGLGLYATVVAISLTAGPPLASTILTFANWNGLFLPNFLLGMLVLTVAFKGLPETEKNVRRFDAWAACLCALMFAFLLIWISGVSEKNWQYILFTFLGFCVSAFLLLHREKGKPAPVFAIDLFRIKMFTLSAMTSISAFSVQGLMFVVLPFFFIDRLGFTQIEAGYLISPWAATLAMMGMIAGPLTQRVHPGVLGFFGLLILSVGLILLQTLTSNSHVIEIVWRLVLCGVGYGLFQSPNMVAMMNSAPRNRSGSAGGILATARLLGQAIGASFVAFCFSTFHEKGVEVSIWIAVTMSLIGAVASVLRVTRFALK